jgi:hypothetical protein
MPEALRRANAAKSTVRSRVEHVFAEQKDQMALFIRTIGIGRARLRSAWPIFLRVEERGACVGLTRRDLSDPQGSSTTSNDCYSCAEPQLHDGAEGTKAPPQTASFPSQ